MKTVDYQSLHHSPSKWHEWPSCYDGRLLTTLTTSSCPIVAIPISSVKVFRHPRKTGGTNSRFVIFVGKPPHHISLVVMSLKFHEIWWKKGKFFKTRHLLCSLGNGIILSSTISDLLCPTNSTYSRYYSCEVSWISVQ
jgi:hypothetical protein